MVDWEGCPLPPPPSFSVCTGQLPGPSYPYYLSLASRLLSLTFSFNIKNSRFDPSFGEKPTLITGSLTRVLLVNSIVVVSADIPHICIGCFFVFSFTFPDLRAMCCLAWYLITTEQVLHFITRATLLCCKAELISMLRGNIKPFKLSQKKGIKTLQY